MINSICLPTHRRLLHRKKTFEAEIDCDTQATKWRDRILYGSNLKRDTTYKFRLIVFKANSPSTTADEKISTASYSEILIQF